ncbi:Glucosamine--fructose-6-phosphate aminotransferase (isomerizing) [Desulfovibrio sp. X2]|uniref:glutamine--fructose-6-phosphate transaminase (isomerizing) n=1 Tax=Desulfovibrio sp. X2 TaxID=941449 RepID=UPI000358CED1|nr:glutamine--fructose-6-phosphate transaminase (isomerizing) [Desulfovibrio sp. X2]EPR44547.1 Glucosamine--fructose-6-phosphate aminotransferase (isomerizing) [Desulfovibrio sp. X2]
MCGIIGYSGHRPAVPVCMEGLRRLEYRGYDSAGVAFPNRGGLTVIKEPGKLGMLEQALEKAGNVLGATSALAHTRWATHGVPNQVNAHPHTDASGKLAMVHNGIIENFAELKQELAHKGVTFQTETDTEVLVKLVGEYRKECATMREALSRALTRAEGAYAVVLVSADHPGRLWAARKQSPLVLGVGVGENFLASDVPAFLPYTREVVFIDDGEMVIIDADRWQILDVATLAPKEKEVKTITWDVQSAQKGGYKHFMLKEIFEQPKVIRDCLAGRIGQRTQSVKLPELEGLPLPGRLVIVACGTSYYAGLWGKYVIEKLARVPVDVAIASEFRYADPILSEGEQVLVVSQSGETADTLAGLRLAKEQGIPVIGLCNVVGSSVARESDHVLYTQAGPEISVASTKAMCSQMVMLLLLALSYAARKGVLDEEESGALVRGLQEMPGLLEESLPAMRESAKALARMYAEADSFLYLGRGACYPLALEGALKLKEISYIHAEGYAAGEMKHGPIALIDPRFPTFAIALADDLFGKVRSNLIEVKARGGKIIALTNPGVELEIDHPWFLPKVAGPLGAFTVLPAVQLFAYEIADYLGKDVDQPRNLAKSVTVE